MAKDYFQDIIPPTGGDGRKVRATSARSSTARTHKAKHEEPEEQEEEIVPVRRRSVPIDDAPAPHSHPSLEDSDNDPYLDDEPIEDEQETLREEVGLRGIRNISIPSRGRSRTVPDMRQAPSLMGGPAMRPQGSPSRLWIWIVAGVLVLVLALFAILATRPSVVTVTPRSHAITFDQSTDFIAYPEASAATGTLTYSVQTIELDDSEVIPAQGGTTHVETKASGTLTVYNSFSTSPVRLVATTRFETPDHLIYRTPNDIVVPGKKGTTPGKVTVTVIADQAGEQFNIAPGVKFTVPGLKTNAPMYTGVTAEATGQFAGGFNGDRVATDPAARATAIANIRARLLESSIQKAATDAGPNGVIFYNLAQTTYQDLPDTTETNGVGIHVRIRSLIPVLPADTFARSIGSIVTSDTDIVDLSLVGGDSFGALSSDIASSTLGTTPFHFKPTGNATLVWNVNTDELLSALAGRDQASFQSIIANFRGIESAHARIEPFWKSTFPEDKNDIKIDIKAPQPASGTAGA